MRAAAFHHSVLPGVRIRSGAVWLSELFATVVVAVVLGGLSLCGALIWFNAVRILKGNQTIATLEREEIELRHALERLRERKRLECAVRTAVGQRISDRTVYELAELVERSSRQYGYDPFLLLAVIDVESRYDVRARGRFRSGAESGAIGLMQLHPETARQIGRAIGVPVKDETDLYDPHVNAALGVAYLTKLIAEFGSFKLGLLAYNQGPGVVRQSLRERRPLSAAYYERVVSAYTRLRSNASEEPTTCRPTFETSPVQSTGSRRE